MFKGIFKNTYDNSLIIYKRHIFNNKKKCKGLITNSTEGLCRNH